MDPSGDARGRDEGVRARRGGGGAGGRPHRPGREPCAGSARQDRYARRRARHVAHDRPPAAQQGEASARPVRAGALGRFRRACRRAGAAGGGARRETTGAAPGECGARASEEWLHAGGGAGAGGRGVAAPGARRAHDGGAAHGRRRGAAPHVQEFARPAGRIEGGRTMATGALDGDVRRLRAGARGGSDDAALGDRPVRSEGGVSEDAFHLTPLDIRKQEFRKALRGYEAVSVEDFRMRVADELERILRDRSVLEERLAALTDQLSAFRERERAMNEALVAAQQLRQDTRAAAEREAQVIVREAEAEARRIAEEARTAETDVRRQLAETERQFQAYLGGFRALLERQMAELRALDGQRGE